ncbi:MAG: hypothetical protein HY774_25275 [Acidobacteria bacterium]|nr:hypothetical protein [Acidobacteriota bacterium]
MNNYKWVILFPALTVILHLVGIRSHLVQEPIKLSSLKQLEAQSDHLAVFIQSKEQNYVVSHKRTSEGAGYSYMRQIYKSEKYSVIANIRICESQEVAEERFKRLGSNGAVGMRLAEIGDKAHGWFDGTLYVRKGNVLVLIYVNPRLSKDEQQHQNQAEQSAGVNQPNSQEEPINRNPNTSTELEIAKRFARHIVGFFEEQAQ